MASPQTKTTDAHRTTAFRFCFAFLCLSFSARSKVLAALIALSLCPLLKAQQTPQEKQLFDELNTARKNAGQPALEWDERLAEAARAHSRLMAEKNKLEHMLPGELPVDRRLAATGIRFNRSGENVSYNSDFDDITHAWLDSPGHRENMLNDNYNVVGIGVAQGDDGTYFATQDFAHALPQRTQQQAEDIVAHSVNSFREQEHRAPLQRITNAGVRDLACSMAESGKLDASRAARLPDVRESVVYNNALPEELPATARKMLTGSQITKYAVGACYAGAEAKSGAETFFVVLAFY